MRAESRSTAMDNVVPCKFRALSSTYDWAMLMEEETISFVRTSNQRSSPTFRVKAATIATTTAGTAATSENNATIRTCKTRGSPLMPPRRQYSRQPHDAIRPSKSSMSTRLQLQAQSWCFSLGTMGVRPIRIKKETIAVASEARTIARPDCANSLLARWPFGFARADFPP